jgi:diphthine-ammonia ligase
LYCASWSGGKDSCMACYLAMQKGLAVSRLVHFDRPFNLHGIDPELIRLQAKLAGIPMVQKRVANEDFEQEFRNTAESLKLEGIAGMVFGDIYLEPHKEWVDRVCGELGMAAEEPLWRMNTEKIMNDFLALGFETIIASGKQELIDKEWIGRKMDHAFIGYLKTKGLDICGENGEFHTFVTGGPLFKGRIEISDHGVAGRNGFWFIDILEYKVTA